MHKCLGRVGVGCGGDRASRLKSTGPDPSFQCVGGGRLPGCLSHAQSTCTRRGKGKLARARANAQKRTRVRTQRARMHCQLQYINPSVPMRTYATCVKSMAVSPNVRHNGVDDKLELPAVRNNEHLARANLQSMKQSSVSRAAPLNLYNVMKDRGSHSRRVQHPLNSKRVPARMSALAFASQVY